jgi:hypothetical protein
MPGRGLIHFGAVALISTFVGCGGAGLETLSGKVTLDGAPLPGAKLFLVSKNAPAGANADPTVKGPFVGVTNEQGQFEIGPVGQAGGGAPPGAYTLTITTAWLEGADETSVTPPQKVPPPYSAGVDFEVPDGGKTDANFDLKSK